MDRVKYYLKAADVFIFPSILEGSPNSVLEAMASGLPVICSNIPNHTEIIENGHNGYVYNNHKHLVEMLNNLKNKKLRSKIGKNARNFVKENHDIRDVAKKYEALYKKCLQ
jgi:glycosyltransferase involved in cell wall biosynthesis